MKTAVRHSRRRTGMRPHPGRRPPSPWDRLRFAGALIEGRLRGGPVILSHLVTGRCNARCPSCLWRDPERPELATDEVLWLYREAAGLGVAQVVVWGGEPLLRPDLPELLEGARRSGLVTVLITNGWSLPDRWGDLAGWVDALIVSLDDGGERHDRLRGLPGLYARLDTFMARLEDDPLRPIVLVNTVLSRLNRGALRRVAPIARRWGAGLYFCPMETGQMQSSGFDGRLADLALPPDELRQAAGLARMLKTAGYPLLATDAYLRALAHDPALARYRCRAPRAVLTVASDGSVRDCLRRDAPLAYVSEVRARGGRLRDVTQLPRYRQMLLDSTTCTACNNPDVIELSWLWDLRPGMLEKAATLIRSSRAG